MAGGELCQLELVICLHTKRSCGSESEKKRIRIMASCLSIINVNRLFANYVKVLISLLQNGYYFLLVCKKEVGTCG